MDDFTEQTPKDPIPYLLDRIAALEERLDTLSDGIDQDLERLTERVAAIESDLDRLDGLTDWDE